eukprot:3325998-Rhodomonas_salina.4
MAGSASFPNVYNDPSAEITPECTCPPATPRACASHMPCQRMPACVRRCRACSAHCHAHRLYTVLLPPRRLPPAHSPARRPPTGHAHSSPSPTPSPSSPPPSYAPPPPPQQPPPHRPQLPPTTPPLADRLGFLCSTTPILADASLGSQRSQPLCPAHRPALCSSDQTRSADQTRAPRSGQPHREAHRCPTRRILPSRAPGSHRRAAGSASARRRI